MSKIVILNNNLEFIRFICNNIFNQFQDVKLLGIAKNLDEFDVLVNKVNPTLIIMDYSDYINSKYSNKSEFKKAKIILCDSTELVKNSSTQLFVAKNKNTNEIIKSISKFIEKHDIRLIRKKIKKFLETFQFDFKLIGTTYLFESILYCYENKTDYVFENLEKNEYPSNNFP